MQLPGKLHEETLLQSHLEDVGHSKMMNTDELIQKVIHNITNNQNLVKMIVILIVFIKEHLVDIKQETITVPDDENDEIQDQKNREKDAKTTLFGFVYDIFVPPNWEVKKEYDKNDTNENEKSSPKNTQKNVKHISLVYSKGLPQTDYQSSHKYVRLWEHGSKVHFQKIADESFCSKPDFYHDPTKEENKRIPEVLENFHHFCYLAYKVNHYRLYKSMHDNSKHPSQHHSQSESSDSDTEGGNVRQPKKIKSLNSKVVNPSENVSSVDPLHSKMFNLGEFGPVFYSDYENNSTVGKDDILNQFYDWTNTKVLLSDESPETESFVELDLRNENPRSYEKYWTLTKIILDMKSQTFYARNLLGFYKQTTILFNCLLKNQQESKEKSFHFSEDEQPYAEIVTILNSCINNVKTYQEVLGLFCQTKEEQKLDENTQRQAREMETCFQIYLFSNFLTVDTY
jgi:hypothetical protein